MKPKTPPPPPAHKPITQKQYTTDQMRRMAFLISDTPAPDGQPQTNGEHLARLLWAEALGWTEIKIDDDGRKCEVYHPPILAVQEKLLDRLDGKALPTPEAGGHTIRAAEKVRTLSKDRMNKMAKAAKGEDAESVL